VILSSSSDFIIYYSFNAQHLVLREFEPTQLRNNKILIKFIIAYQPKLLEMIVDLTL
jgi:hypothetical protein